MANIKKNFNFRNGVQVDDDNLLVTTTGLVGIGTTIPIEALDVRGNVNITGFCSFTTANIGIMTISTIKPTEIIGAGVSIKSGIVTAEGAGIVTYYGDARFLQGMPTSQWQDIDVGLGFTSIYNAGGNVGIATTDPRATLQIGGDVDSSQEGIGISSVGNIKATGIVTATSFVGALTGNVTGNITGDVTGNSTGNLTGLVNSTGISTFGGINATGRIVGAATSNVIPFFYSNLSDLPSAVTYHGAFAHVHATGRGYYAHGGNWIELVNKDTSGNISLSGDLDIDGHTNLDNVSISGVSTFRDDVDFVGDTVGTALTSIQFHKGDGTNSDLDALRFYDSAAIDLGFGNTGNMRLRGNFGNSSFILGYGENLFIDGSSFGNTTIKIRTRDARNGIVVNPDTTSGTVELYHSSGGTATKRLETSGIGVTITNQLDTTNIVASGVITATTELNSPLLGVGTNDPANDIQVRKSGNAEIQVTSDTGVAGLTVGRESGTNNTNNAEFRYGGGAGFPYSSAQSLDIINYGTGNFNYHLSANNAGSTAGNFFWHKGSSNVRLMTLTNSGRLGIGLTEPTDELHVAGGVTVVGALAVGGNINLTGTMIGDVQGTVIGNVVGVLAGNTNATVGISTLNNLSVAGIATIQNQKSTKISIGENPADDLFRVFISSDKNVFVNDIGQVGVNTNISLPGVGINASSTNAVVAAIGVGVTQFNNGSVNFSNAGLSTNRFMVPPRVTTAQRNSLVGLISGAMVYVTDLAGGSKLQVYNGSAWETITSS